MRRRRRRQCRIHLEGSIEVGGVGCFYAVVWTFQIPVAFGYIACILFPSTHYKTLPSRM
jgi:hypothetical protein